MKKLIRIWTTLGIIMAASSMTNAEMSNFITYTAEGAGLSIDAVGLQNNTDGVVQADIPVGAQIYRAYLYSASVWDDPLYDVQFEGMTLISDAASRLDVGAKNTNVTSENRWDVTGLVNAKVGGGSGLFDFTVCELGYLDGEILSVIYSIPTEAVKTVMIFDGELSTTGDSFNVNLSPAFDGSDIIMSLGISFSHQASQYTIVNVNGQRLTSSAGGEDDGFAQNGGLITAGGIGDSIANPIDPFAGPGGNPRYDDELYNLAPFLNIGDNLISIDTLNPSHDDNVFFVGFEIPEPATVALLGLGALSLLRRRKNNQLSVDRKKTTKTAFYAAVM